MNITSNFLVVEEMSHRTRAVVFSSLVALLVLVLFVGSYKISFGEKETSFAFIFITSLSSLFVIFMLSRVTPIDERFPVPFYQGTNGSMEKVIKESINLFNLAKNEILITNGELDHIYYDDPEILEALGAISKKGVKIKIICEDTIDQQTVNFMALSQRPENDIQIFSCPEKLEKHLMIVDGIHVRIEKCHEKAAEERPARFYFYSDYLGNTAINKFEQYLEKSSLLFS